MKCLFLLLIIMLFVVVISNAQTNIINIYNSHVVINNIANISTNNVKTNNRVVLAPKEVERLQWEIMLDQRRRASFKSFLKKYK
jgi:hypothetical protein